MVISFSFLLCFVFPHLKAMMADRVEFQESIKVAVNARGADAENK